MAAVHFERKGPIAIITMEGDNDLNLGVVVGDEMHERLTEYRDDDNVWCAIVTGAGERAFSAGNDLKAIVARGGARTVGGDFWATKPLNLMTGAEFWKPLIAAVNGHAVGGGLMLALACDIRIASENATFSLPEIKFGFPPGHGALQRLPRMIPFGPAMEMLLTGDRISALQACQWGLVNNVVPLPQLMDSAMALAERVVSNPPLAVRATKEIALRSLEMTFEQGARLGATLSQICRQTEDAREGMLAFVEKRRPTFSGR